MKLVFTYSIIILICLVASFKSLARTPPFRVWSNVLFNTNLSPDSKWLYSFLLEGRFADQPGLFYEGLFQNQVGYSPSDRTKVWMGLTWIPMTVITPTGRVSTNTHRIYQQLDASLFKNLNYEINSRSRLEERHRMGDSGIGLVYRQLFIINIPQLMVRDTLTPFLSNELLVNVNTPIWSNQKHINQNRFMVGWNFPCSIHRCQLAYLNQFLIGRFDNQINNILFFSLII